MMLSAWYFFFFLLLSRRITLTTLSYSFQYANICFVFIPLHFILKRKSSFKLFLIFFIPALEIKVIHHLRGGFIFYYYFFLCIIFWWCGGDAHWKWIDGKHLAPRAQTSLSLNEIQAFSSTKSLKRTPKKKTIDIRPHRSVAAAKSLQNSPKL